MHFRKNSKLQILDEAKKLDVSGEIVNGLKHIDSFVIDDKNQRDHTRWLLSNGYSSMKLPNCDTEGFKKRPTISLSNVFRNAGFKATSSKVISDILRCYKYENAKLNKSVPIMVQGADLCF